MLFTEYDGIDVDRVRRIYNNASAGESAWQGSFEK